PPYTLFDSPELNGLIQLVITPLTLAFPLMLWTWVERYPVSDAYELMGDKAWKIPTALRIFYGFNFTITIIFLLPLGAPFLALTGGYFIGLTLFGVEEGEFQLSRRSIQITTLLYGIFAMVIGLIFLINIVELYTTLFEYWVDHLDFIYRSALNLADAVALGSVVYVIYEIRMQKDVFAEVPDRLITILSVVVFIVLETLLIFLYDSTGSGVDFLSYIHWGIIIAAISMVLIKYFLVSGDETSSSIKGWFSIVLFQFVGLFEKTAASFLRSAAIFFAFLIFGFIFAVSYYQAKQRF
ncbi:MAG: hypothetical protein ACTSRU_14735, partial [Candidatus Hodarchaeales archaeon]